MDSKTYWMYVDRTEQKLKDDHQNRASAFKESGDASSWNGQPTGGLEVFCTSVEHFEKGTSAGTVYVLHRRLAAQRIVEGTHKVADASEIKGHLAHLERNRREADMMEIRRNRQFVTNVPHSGVDTASPEFAAAVQAAVKAAVEDMLGSKEAGKPKGEKVITPR